MTGAEITECVGIVQRICPVILGVIDARRGISTSTLRRYVGRMSANAGQYLTEGVIAEWLGLCMNEARLLGASLVPFGNIRTVALAEAPVTLPGTAVKQVIIRLCLSHEARIVASTAFRSVDDAAVVASMMSAAFDAAVEVAADELQTDSYMTLIRLRASVSRHLSETVRRLPRIVTYEMPDAVPSLVISQRFYQTGARSDELAQQNRVVHPAFCPPQGKMLAV
jgi:hypothetical protein